MGEAVPKHGELRLRLTALFARMVSLKFAATLVSADVLDARKKILDTDVDAAQWEADVVPASLRLLQVTLPTLSRGWSSGLVGIFVFLGSIATVFFIGLVIFGPEARAITIICLSFFLPCRSC